MSALTGRPILTKSPRLEMPKLRQSAKDAPHCMNPGCLRSNHDKRCVLAHANWLDYGKGVGLKTSDIFGAILCNECHDYVDRGPHQYSADRRHLWERAHRATLVYWIQAGILRC